MSPCCECLVRELCVLVLARARRRLESLQGLRRNAFSPIRVPPIRERPTSRGCEGSAAPTFVRIGGGGRTNGADRLRRIAELARSVSSTLDLATVLNHVTAAVTALRPDVVCSVRLIDPVAGGYRLAGAGGVPIAGRTQVIPFGRGLTHAVAEAAPPLLVEAYPGDPRAIEGHWSAGRGLTVYYGVPIGAPGELLGVLSVNLPGGGPPTREERERIEALAGQAAGGVRNARLFIHSGAR